MFIYAPKISAQERYFTVDSLEVRSFVFSQLTNDDIYFENVDDKKKLEPVLLTQNNDKKFFIFYIEESKNDNFGNESVEDVKINSNTATKGLEDLFYRIRIIPDQDAVSVQNVKEGYGAWDVILDKSKSLESLLYYFQAREGYYINFSTLGNSTNISVYIENIEYISNVSVPYPLVHLMRMSLDDIISITRRYIKWNTILPQRQHFVNYELSRQFAVYLENKRQLKPNLVLGSEYRLYDDIQNMLAYIGSANNVNFDQFFPIYGNKQRVPVNANDYLQRYTQNAKTFLNALPEFEVQLSNQVFEKALREQTFNQIFFRLYLSALKYPRVWYLILSGVESQSNENQEEIYNNVHVTVPYFTPSGKFEVFFPREIEKSLVQNALKRDSVTANQLYDRDSQVVANILYLFRAHSLRVPLSNIGAREHTSRGTRFGVKPELEVLPPPKTRFDP